MKNWPRQKKINLGQLLCSCLIAWPLFVLLFSSLTFSQDDPFETIAAEPSEDSSSKPSGKKGSKPAVDVPADFLTEGNKEEKAAESNTEEDPILGAAPKSTPTPAPTPSEADKLLTNSESTETATTSTEDKDKGGVQGEFSVESVEAKKAAESSENTEGSDTNTAALKKKKGKKSKQQLAQERKERQEQEKREAKGSLETFDMEKVGRDGRPLSARPSLEIYGRDSETGLVHSFDTSHDRSRFSLFYHGSSDLRGLSEIRSFQANFGYYFGFEREGREPTMSWLEFMVHMTSGKFSNFAVPNKSMAIPNRQEMDDTVENITTIGIGYSLRSHWVRDFALFGERWYENTSAYITSNTFNEKYFEKKYNGYGILAQFGLCYRMSQSVQLGPSFSYHLISVRRPEEGNPPETSDQRSLLLTWTSLGLDFTYYFK